MTPRKLSALPASESAERPCAYCEALERQYEDAISHIREVLELRFENVGQKVRELHRWQENRDEALEGFYRHKLNHRKSRNALRRTAA